MKNIRNTGIKVVQTLQLVYVSDGTPVVDRHGKIITKKNKVGDPDYIEPFEDFSDCPTINSPFYPTEEELACLMTDVEFSIIDSEIINGNFVFVLGVNKTDVVYEFKNPITGQWNPATIGKNQTSYTVLAEGQAISILVRKPNCDDIREVIINVPIPPVLDIQESTIIIGYL